MKKKAKQALQQQTEENIEELKRMGIHYVTCKEYLENPDKYKYAIGLNTAYGPKRFNKITKWLRMKLNG